MTLPPSPAPRPPAGDWRAARDVRDLIRRLWAMPVVRLIFYAVLTVLAVRALLWGSQLLASVLLTVLTAYGLAFLVNPILEWLERRRVGRMVGVLLLLLLLLGLTTLLIMTLSQQIAGLISGIPVIAINLKIALFNVLDRLDSIQGVQGLKASVSTYIDEQTNNITENAGPLLERLLNSGPNVLNTLSNLVGWLGQLGFIVTLAAYFMLDYERVGHSLLRVFPRQSQPTVLRLAEDVSQSFGGFLRGQLLLMLTGAVLSTLGLLALNVPNALALGALSGLLSLVPYIGIVLAAVAAMLQAIPQGGLTIGLVAALFFVINQLQGNVLGPLIMGRVVSLSPAAILIALLVGLALAGPVGAIIAIPTATLLKRWLERYWMTSAAYRGVGGAVPEELQDGAQR
ncbi:AI-2E family transporter [Deinococcus radiopugnans]|uniref:AI-2E family transporter n=1 Tax=Deinococcus radiopugnans ATCC 19172 TaxID=585398 RepID=A0A5C4Y2T6_9DEIO|nr:AI-2E family transporter [Deinococcus radiopugnans]MBB6017519.1 putative PurR-regulated permease PerM [Deinococcus radiopugnans ATCC 19172]TNM69776.1 AI-2E family transporter [Deinococcus radiopugnans ATCC 19172]